MIAQPWRIRRWATAHLGQLDVLEVLPVLTVLVLLLRAPDAWYLQVPMTMLGILGLTFRSWLKTSAFWYLAATLLGTTIYFQWEAVDNHKYLMAYWCITLCCVFSLPSHLQRSGIACSARWTIGLCMAWAVLWKVLSPDYLNGSFFHYTLLVDERFAMVARLLAGVPASSLADNRHLHDLLLNGHLRGLEVASVGLADTWQVRKVALLLTWWTVLIEAGLAVLFLLPDRARLRTFRNAGLLAFGITTYAVAPVIGFGWMLMLLGMAQTGRRQQAWRLGYLAAFLLIQAYMLPVSDVVQLVGRFLSGPAACCGL